VVEYIFFDVGDGNNLAFAFCEPSVQGSGEERRLGGDEVFVDQVWCFGFTNEDFGRVSEVFKLGSARDGISFCLSLEG